MAGGKFMSSHVPGAGENILATPDHDVWADRLRKFKICKAAAPPAPVETTWLPLGPALLLHGNTAGSQPVAGRVSGMAVDPSGQIVYAATACGGVFRSDNGGMSWRSCMDGFDLDPRHFASSSLACGAIAIDPADPNRVYVGTGEGDTHHLFRRRLVHALPAYRGIGPIRSDDGGLTWATEPTVTGSPDLAGKAFFALAVDQYDRDRVVAATTVGLYQRVPQAGGGFAWKQRRRGVHSSVVVVSSGGIRRFFAAKWGGGVVQSSDGSKWTAVGTGFPRTGVGRIALGAQPTNLDVIYAFVANRAGRLKGVYRLASGIWRKLRDVPPVVAGKQGNYDLAIAVDPEDINLIYLGGDGTGERFFGSVWRGIVSQRGSLFRLTEATSIGEDAHVDIHVLTHTPNEPNELWCGCDGGVFLNRDPQKEGRFASHNVGLSCLCSNFIAQHPRDPNILFTGLQDNGTARTEYGPVWSRVEGGDGGYCVVHWHNPKKVLVSFNGGVSRSTTGGSTLRSWSAEWGFTNGTTMTPPLVSAPFKPANPADADFVAIGVDNTVFTSRDFAKTLPLRMRIILPRGSGKVFALAFASTTRLFIGTTRGLVFRADRPGKGTWKVEPLKPPPLEGLITDIAVDWADADRASVYIVFGGMGDNRHVWRFDGARWEDRSGHGRYHLLDVEHNALVVDDDPQHRGHLYVGADIGVWHSPDAGRTWTVMQNGLPDAPVFDLQLHPTQRLLRAALHGRGVYEIALP